MKESGKRNLYDYCSFSCGPFGLKHRQLATRLSSLAICRVSALRSGASAVPRTKSELYFAPLAQSYIDPDGSVILSLRDSYIIFAPNCAKRNIRTCPCGQNLVTRFARNNSAKPNITAKQYNSPQANITEKTAHRRFFLGSPSRARTYNPYDLKYGRLTPDTVARARFSLFLRCARALPPPTGRRVTRSPVNSAGC